MSYFGLFLSFFFSPCFSARSSPVFPSLLIYTEDLGKYVPRYLFLSLVELFQTKYVPLGNITWCSAGRWAPADN